MKNSGIQNVEGVAFTSQRKQEMASLLKERMMNAQYFLPYFTWETPYRSEYVAELNIEKFKLMKDGLLTVHQQRKGRVVSRRVCQEFFV